jgi:NAD(P)-dependent dehydrogenase (short-subunit alcohol dehydrogenase family)
MGKLDGKIALVTGGTSGIATRLARTALEFARDHQVVVVPVCPFVVAYLQQHPDFNSLVRPTRAAPQTSLD